MKPTNADPQHRKRWYAPVTWTLLAGAAALGATAIGACAKDSEPAGPFSSFDQAANDTATFTEPRDAVPLDNGAIAFIARSTGNVAVDPANAADPEALSQLKDRYALFIIDAPGAPARVLYKDLIAPFNLASNGVDQLYVADIGAGKTSQGAIVQVGVGGGAATLLAEGYKPQGVATDAAGTVYFSGTAPTGQPGVFKIQGNAATPVVMGGQFKSPSGLDVDVDGTIYVADSTATANLDDDSLVTGTGHGVLFKITGNTASVIYAGFNAGYPTGIAISGTKIAISGYADRGSNSAVIIVDLNALAAEPTIYTDKIKSVFTSAGLHRSRATGTLAWSGGDTVFVINKK